MTHAAVAYGLGVALRPRRRALFSLLMVGMAILPDIDIIAFPLGVPYDSQWSHRGLSHSLAGAFVVSGLTALATRRWLGMPWWMAWSCLFVAMASHGVLDSFNASVRGVALLAPFDSTRYFAPWRPVLPSPMGFRFLSARGFRAFASELTWLWAPTAIVVGACMLWRRRRARRLTARTTGD